MADDIEVQTIYRGDTWELSFEVEDEDGRCVAIDDATELEVHILKADDSVLVKKLSLSEVTLTNGAGGKAKTTGSGAQSLLMKLSDIVDSVPVPVDFYGIITSPSLGTKTFVVAAQLVVIDRPFA